MQNRNTSSFTHDGRLGDNLLHTESRVINPHPFTLSAYLYGVSYPGGLTAVMSPNLTRSSIFDSLKGKSAYGTTWINRHLMNFTINGLQVGENDSTLIVPDKFTPRTLEIMVASDELRKCDSERRWQLVCS